MMRIRFALVYINSLPEGIDKAYNVRSGYNKMKKHWGVTEINYKDSFSWAKIANSRNEDTSNMPNKYDFMWIVGILSTVCTVYAQSHYT